MKKLIIGLLILGFLLISSQPQAIEKSEKSRIFNHLNKASSHAVSIIKIAKNGGIGACSGIVLKNTLKESYVLTAKHCTVMSDEMYVNTIRATTIQISTSQDLALLKTNERIPDKFGSKLALQNASRGEELFGIGYPDVTIPYVMQGKVFIPGLKLHFGIIKAIPGCSGSGLYNDEGSLVGILRGGTKKFTTYVPVTKIKKFLKEAGYEE